MTNPSEVLVVDAQNAMRELLVDCLQMKGVPAITAMNGAEAYRLLEERALARGPAFLAVVSDWVMPVLDGLGLLHRIRSGEFQWLPFVLISGAVSITELRAAVKYGPDAVLLKPFAVDALYDKVHEAAAARARKTLSERVARTR